MLLSFIHFHIFSTINQTYIMIILIIFEIKYNLVILFFYDLNIIFNLSHPLNHSQTSTNFTLNPFTFTVNPCSCREQTRSVRHKYYLTLVCHLLSGPLPGWYVSFRGISEWSVWTREGLPAKGTPKLKSTKSLKKSNLVIREVMNAYL